MLFSDQWPAATYERRQELWQLHQEYTLQFMWFLQHDDALPLQVTPTLHKPCAALTMSRVSDEILFFWFRCQPSAVETGSFDLGPCCR